MAYKRPIIGQVKQKNTMDLLFCKLTSMWKTQFVDIFGNWQTWKVHHAVEMVISSDEVGHIPSNWHLTFIYTLW